MISCDIQAHCESLQSAKVPTDYQLTDRAQKVFAALPSDNTDVYEKVKATFLLHYNNNEDAYVKAF